MILRGRRFIVNGMIPPDPGEPIGDLKFHITFATTPTSANATMLPNKFGKKAWVCQQFDDNEFDGHDNAVAIWEANHHGYTDGCGNFIGCSAEVELVINGAQPEFVSRMNYVISKRGALGNHSAYHNNVADPNNPDDPNDPNNAITQVKVIDDQMISLMNYYMTTFKIPNNATGFAHASSLFNYRGIASEGDYFDEFIPQRHYRLIPDTPVLPFDCFVMILRDDHAAAETKQIYKDDIDRLKVGTANFSIMGSHTPIVGADQVAGFKEVYDYLFQQMGDTVIVCTMKEFLDYRTMRTANMTQSLSGNTLTISIDSTGLNPRTFYYDTSLHIDSDAQILNVEVEGFTNTTFNTTTNLVNGFKQKSIQ